MKNPQLRISSVFSLGTDRIAILAHEPDDYTQDVVMLELSGKTVQFKESLPWHIRATWQSANGTVYATTLSGEVVLYKNGNWHPEAVTDEALRAIWGVSESTPQEDKIIVACEDNAGVWTRHNAVWTNVTLPEETNMINSIAAQSADKIYLTAGDAGILLWNGIEVISIYGADSDDFSGLLTCANGDVFATGDQGLYHWSEVKKEWFLHSISPLTIGIIEHQGKIFLATEDGILCWDGKGFNFVAKGFYANWLTRANNTLFALGADDGLWVQEGEQWRAIDIPISLVPK